MLFCYVRAFALAFRLSEKKWRPSVRPLEDTLDGCLMKVMKEIDKRLLSS